MPSLTRQQLRRVVAAAAVEDRLVRLPGQGLPVVSDHPVAEAEAGLLVGPRERAVGPPQRVGVEAQEVPVAVRDRVDVAHRADARIGAGRPVPVGDDLGRRHLGVRGAGAAAVDAQRTAAEVVDGRPEAQVVDRVGPAAIRLDLEVVRRLLVQVRQQRLRRAGRRRGGGREQHQDSDDEAALHFITIGRGRSGLDSRAVVELEHLHRAGRGGLDAQLAEDALVEVLLDDLNVPVRVGEDVDRADVLELLRELGDRP